MDEKVFTVPNSELVVTRRHFLYGAVGVGAIAAASTAANALGLTGEKDEDLNILKVANSQVTDSSALSEVEASLHMALVGDFKIAYGSLVWCNDSYTACCLVPGSSAKPLTQIEILRLSSGSSVTVVEHAVGQEEGFEIYDARATSQGLIWTEADILEGVWRVYTAVMTPDGVMGTPVKVDEADHNWETPTIELVGNMAFWQVMPRKDGECATANSAVKQARVGSSEVWLAYSSKGRLATPPYATESGIVITPRAESASVHYQLTYLDAQSGSVLDSVVLPQSMKPLAAGYGDTGFTFCFEGIYDYGDGISNLGTYVPQTQASWDGYSNANWFRWTRTPSCAPAWCGGKLICKSTSAVCGIDLHNNTYFAFDVETGTPDYGEFLASSGSRSTVVTYSNVDSHPIDGEASQYCRVRVWQALS